MIGWILGLTGLTGFVGLGALAIVGVPILPTLAKMTDSLVTPLLSVIGQGFASLVQLEITGGVDILQTGQRMLFVVTCCACTWGYSHHVIWQQVHSKFTLFEKHSVTTIPKATLRHRR